jgi:hypothetical protein
MARDDHADRVPAVGGPDGPGGAGPADALGQLGIGGRGAERDVQQRMPHRALERRAVQLQVDVEHGALAREVAVELLGDRLEGAGCPRAPPLGLRCPPALLEEEEPAELAFVAQHGDRPERAVDDVVSSHAPTTSHTPDPGDGSQYDLPAAKFCVEPLDHMRFNAGGDVVGPPSRRSWPAPRAERPFGPRGPG